MEIKEKIWKTKKTHDYRGAAGPEAVKRILDANPMQSVMTVKLKRKTETVKSERKNQPKET